MAIQDKFNKSNVIYKITKDINLGGGVLTIPSGCTLDFQGGSFSNGTIVGSNTAIIAGFSQIFKDVKFQGTWKVHDMYPEWFGAKGDGVTDDSSAIQSAIEAAKLSSTKSVELSQVTYKITKSLTLYTGMRFGNKASSEVDNYINPHIEVVGDIDGIILDQGTTGRIENITIEGVGLYGNTIIGNGIAFYGDPTQISGVFYCTFKAIFAYNFHNGMYFQTNGYAGFAYSKIERCQLRHNTIGLQIKGVEFNNAKCWFNVNEISMCSIGSNRIGGILIDGINQTNAVTISTCSIEVNGKDYSDAEYEKYGCSFGIKLVGGSLGAINVRDCYIEANYPERTVNGVHEFPTNISTDCATFIIAGSGLKVQNCFIQAYGLVGICSEIFQATFMTNQWGRTIEGTNNNGCLFILDISHPYMKNYARFIFKEDNEINYSIGEANLYKLRGTNTDKLSNVVIDIDSSKYGIFRHREGKIITNRIYISDNGKPYGFGFTQNDPFPNLETILEMMYYGNIKPASGDSFEITIVDSATFTKKQDYHTISYPCTINSTARTNTLTLNNPLPIASTLNISGCTLILPANVKSFTDFRADGLRCNINWSIIKFNNNSQVLFGNTKNYRNCSGTVVNQTHFSSETGSNNYIFDISKNAIDVSLTDIQVASGYTPVNRKLNTDNNYIVVTGASSSRPNDPQVGQMFIDTTLNKMIWYTGSNWRDATGTVV